MPDTLSIDLIDLSMPDLACSLSRARIDRKSRDLLEADGGVDEQDDQKDDDTSGNGEAKGSAKGRQNSGAGYRAELFAAVDSDKQTSDNEGREGLTPRKCVEQDTSTSNNGKSKLSA